MRLYSIEIELQVLFGVGVTVSSRFTLEISSCEGGHRQHRGCLVQTRGIFEELAYVLSGELSTDGRDQEQRWWRCSLSLDRLEADPSSSSLGSSKDHSHSQLKAS